MLLYDFRCWKSEEEDWERRNTVGAKWDKNWLYKHLTRVQDETNPNIIKFKCPWCPQSWDQAEGKKIQSGNAKKHLQSKDAKELEVLWLVQEFFAARADLTLIYGARADLQ